MFRAPDIWSVNQGMLNLISAAGTAYICPTDCQVIARLALYRLIVSITDGP